MSSYGAVLAFLRGLHWLSVRARIDWHIDSLWFHELVLFLGLHGLAPAYLSEVLTPFYPSRFLYCFHAFLSVKHKINSTDVPSLDPLIETKYPHFLSLILRTESTFKAFKFAPRPTFFKKYFLQPSEQFAHSSIFLSSSTHIVHICHGVFCLLLLVSFLCCVFVVLFFVFLFVVVFCCFVFCCTEHWSLIYNFIIKVRTW